MVVHLYQVGADDRLRIQTVTTIIFTYSGQRVQSGSTVVENGFQQGGGMRLRHPLAPRSRPPDRETLMKKINAYGIAAVLSFAAVVTQAAVAGADPVPLTPAPVAESIDAQADFDNALGNAANEFGLATGVGSLSGTLVAAPVGCAAGSAAGAALMPPAFLPGAVGGCIAGAIAGLALGTASGTAALGVPAGIGAAARFFDTINAPSADAANQGTDPGASQGADPAAQAGGDAGK
ncbi:hypothetical protein [Nocardia stercoris]|nr:hypothetical protein [Nocardia stercoris]